MTTQEIKSALLWAQGVQQAVAFSKVLDAQVNVRYTPANDHGEDGQGISVSLMLYGSHTNEIAYNMDAVEYIDSKLFEAQRQNVERLLKAFIPGYGKKENPA